MAEPTSSLTQHVRPLPAGAHVVAAAFLAGEPALALADGASVRLESACGACKVEVRVDDSVQTGALEMAASHALLALGELKDGAWRAAATKVVRL